MTELATEAPFAEGLRPFESARKGKPVQWHLTGLNTEAKALYLTLASWRLKRPILAVTAGNKEAESLYQCASAFSRLLPSSPHTISPPLLLPSLDVLPFQRLSPHGDILRQRAIALNRIASGFASVVVAPIASALLRTEDAAFYRRLLLKLTKGEELLLEDVVTYLEEVGYRRGEPVEMVGDFSVRGGILDIFPPEALHPIRVEFFGDEIESMRRFDAGTQRSLEPISECDILPLVEYPKSHQLFVDLQSILGTDVVPAAAPFEGWQQAVAAARQRTHQLMDLAPMPILAVDEPAQVQAVAEKLWQRMSEADSCLFPPERAYMSYEEWAAAAKQLPSLLLDELELLDTPLKTAESTHIGTRPGFRFHGHVPQAIEQARRLREQSYTVIVFAANSGELERLADIFEEYECAFEIDLPVEDAARSSIEKRGYRTAPEARIVLTIGDLSSGFLLPASKIAFYGNEDLFERSGIAERISRPGQHLASFTLDITDLKPGDFVVHREHGIGRFLGLKEVLQDGVTLDFMLIEYANESKLYLPLTRMDLVQKYRGAGDTKPQIDRLGGATWQRTKSRVKARMRDMADELLKLYAQRKLARGYAFSADSNWQREFEDSFEYTETEDQIRAIAEIKRDMESDHPMDRLLCGDVGYGKTEVAMRAAFKALGDGKQVAVLAPTTVLAFQHFETFKRRFAAFPVHIDSVSRFRTSKEIKQSLADLASGRTDVVIGTHRLLSKDVEFHDLGLLIIDEEQRFGVRHKERLKQLRHNVDSLTLSATPIPRTLHMSLLGLRDLSVIETPPKDRLSIHTVVARDGDEVIHAALEQELARGGQVYYIHNRVDTIFGQAHRIQRLMPGARVGVGHGQMADAELEKVVHGFMRHEFDVLVSTSIVENGLDIPAANTIIVEHADRFGLSALYQLRGRVGRSNRRAYAYLLVPANGDLSEIARKRLAALKEFSDLGAGFKIAALDLELRGAGNLLGGEQHGHIDAIGYDTFMSMLEETVHDLRGEDVPPEIHSAISLGVEARIPATYIEDEQQRLRAYKKIADIAHAADVQRVIDELRDRYGTPPEEIFQLAEFSLVKSMANELGIETLEKRGQNLQMKFHPLTRVDPQKLMRMVQRVAGAQFAPTGMLRLPLKPWDSASHLLSQVKACLLDLQ